MGQVPPALCFSSLQDFLATLCSQTGQETKGSLSLDGGRLVGVTSGFESFLDEARKQGGNGGGKGAQEGAGKKAEQPGLKTGHSGQAGHGKHV